jgi:hemerythrin
MTTDHNPETEPSLEAQSGSIRQMEWTDSLKTGVSDIDEQHQKLFDIINTLIIMHNYGKKDPLDVLKILFDLSDYSSYHFRLEKTYMHRYRNRNFIHHIEEHDWYIIKLKKFADAFERNEKGLELDIMTFLKEWWTEHIHKLDMELASIVLEKDK